MIDPKTIEKSICNPFSRGPRNHKLGDKLPNHFFRLLFFIIRKNTNTDIAVNATIHVAAAAAHHSIRLLGIGGVSRLTVNLREQPVKGIGFWSGSSM